MKKIVIGIIVVVVLVIGGSYGYYYGNMWYLKAKAKVPIEKAVKSMDIPKSDLYVIKDNTYYTADSVDDVYKIITTKSDYKQWEKLVLRRDKYFIGTKLKNKRDLNKIENCEITYYITYEKNTKKETIDYVLAGNSISKKSEKNIFITLKNK